MKSPPPPLRQRTQKLYVVELCLDILWSWLEYKSNGSVADTWSIVDTLPNTLNLIWRMATGYLLQVPSFDINKENSW